MTQPNAEQQKQIDDAVKAAQSKLNANNTVQVIVTGSGKVTCDNPRFKIEKRTE